MNKFTYLITLICVICAVEMRPSEDGSLKLQRAKRNQCENTDEEKKVVCYVANWAKYRPGDGKYTLDDVDTSLCTHLIYAFVKVDPNSNGLKADYPDEMTKLADLKKKNPDLKVMVAAGGWGPGSDAFKPIAADPNRQEQFANNVAEFLNKYNLDGFDVDWEYPNKDNSNPSEKSQFPEMLKKLHEKLGENDKLLSAAVGIGEATVKNSYDVENVVKNVDFVNLMTYDLAGAWGPSGTTGHHTNNEQVEQAINRWAVNGVDKGKLVMGSGAYGRSFKASNTMGMMGTQHTGKGDAGPYTREAGTLAYSEICKKIKDGELKLNTDDPVNPTAFSQDTIVGFDTAASIEDKNQMAKRLCLGGGMMWSVEQDDFKGLCGEGANPLLNAINDVWRNGDTASKPTKATPEEPRPSLTNDNNPARSWTPTSSGNTVSNPTSGTNDSSPSEPCDYGKTGVKKPATNAHEYWECVNENWMKRSCGSPALKFDQASSVCVWA